MALFIYVSVTKIFRFFLCVYKNIAHNNNEALLSDVKDKNTVKTGNFWKTGLYFKMLKAVKMEILVSFNLQVIPNDAKHANSNVIDI